MISEKALKILLNMVYNSGELIAEHSTDWTHKFNLDVLRKKAKEIINCKDKKHNRCFVFKELMSLAKGVSK